MMPMMQVQPLGEVGDFITGVGTVTLAAIAVLTVAIGAFQYGKQRAASRGRWLMDLHDRFVSSRFKDIRCKLYGAVYNQEDRSTQDPNIIELIRKRRSLGLATQQTHVGQPAEVQLSERERKIISALDDYLDFLGLVGHLTKQRELTEKDARAMFKWYVVEGLCHPEIECEVEQRFPELSRLRSRFSDVSTQQEDGGKWRKLRAIFSRSRAKKTSSEGLAA
jgi:hypothetical protein